MADGQSRSFSTQYKGQSISPIPSGYLETYAQIGRSIAATGETVGKAIESYQAGKAEREGQTAIAEQNAAMWEDEVVKMYGPDSKELQDWRATAAKASSMSLSQLKAWNATNMGRGEQVKRMMAINEYQTVATRDRIIAARGEVSSKGKIAFDTGPIETASYTFRSVEEIDKAEQELEGKWQALLTRAQSEGRDPRDPAYQTELQALTSSLTSIQDARKKVNERVNSKTVRNTNADAIAGVAQMVADAEAATEAPADAVADAAGKVKAEGGYSAPAKGGAAPEEGQPPAEDTVDRSKPIGETPLGYPVFAMRKKDGTSAFFIEGQGEVTEEYARRIGLDPKALPPRQFRDDSVPNKQVVPKNKGKMSDMLTDWADRTRSVLEGTPLEGVFDAPDFLDVVESAGSRNAGLANPKGEMQASADRFYKSAQAMQTAAESTLAAIEKAEANGTIGKMFLRTTTEPLVQEGDTGSLRPANVERYGLVDSSTQERYNPTLLLDTPEKVAQAKATLREQIKGIRTGINVFNARFKELEFEADGTGLNVKDVEVGKGTPKKEGAPLLEAAATAAAAGKAPIKADLTIPFKETVGRLNKGEVVEFNPFDEDGNLSPMMRVLAAANPDLQLREGGAFNYDAAGSALARMFNANVRIEDGKVILQPLEAEPVTVETTDINSARTYDEAQTIARRNYIIDFLKQRNIPPTPENIEFVMTGGLAGGRKIEWTSQGVFSSAPALSEKDKIELETARINLASKEQDLANSRVSGTIKLAELQSGVIGRDAAIDAQGNVSAKPLLMNPSTFQRDPTKGIFLRSVGVVPAKQVDEIRQSVDSAVATIDQLRVSIPDRLNRIAEQLTAQDGQPRKFIRDDGSIDGVALANDERALREYLGEVFSVVRKMGKGLGALAGNDYVFLFTQVGVPVTWQEIIDGEGTVMDRLISGGIKSYAQSNPDYFNNALGSIENQMMSQILRVTQQTNGKIQVAMGNRAVDSEGNLRPFDDKIQGEIVSAIAQKSGNAENKGGQRVVGGGMMGQMVDVYMYPQNYISGKTKMFNTPEEAMRGAIRSIAVQTGYPEEYVARTLEFMRGQPKPQGTAPAAK